MAYIREGYLILMNMNYAAFGISKQDAQLFKDTFQYSRGFIGIHQHPQGAMVVCDSHVNAEFLRSVMEEAGCQVGKEVHEFPCTEK